MEDPREEPQVPKGKVTIRAVVKRADGTVEDLGVISEGYLEDWSSASDNRRE